MLEPARPDSIKEKNELRLLVDHVGDEWWREVHLLYAAQSDASHSF
jgi:hypothetical protein